MPGIFGHMGNPEAPRRAIRRVVTLALSASVWLFCAPLSAQLLIPTGSGGSVRAFGSDAAVLETQEVRKDLPCTVTPVKPSLGFDLRFHGGYEVAIPLKDLVGQENLLTTVFRVTRTDQPDKPVYFTQHINVPKIDDDARGDAYLQGGFDLGEGEYHVDWLMRDRAERVCSFYWDSQATLPPRDKEIKLSVAGGSVLPVDPEPFREEPPVPRDSTAPLNVKVMVNFAPQRRLSATLQPIDTAALVSILRSISREPRICKFTVIAFNMQEQRVLYRQESEKIDFPALGESLNSLNLGTVDVARLEQKHGDSDFLTQLFEKEVGKDNPDALIFAGPKVMTDQAIPSESLKQLADLSYPVFYLNYNLNPQAMPWRDTIGNAVKHLKGFEYTISRPRDVWVAWTDIMARIVRLKLGRTSATSSQ
jgi:hypothetical protein